jgi:hypothetical protein
MTVVSIANPCRDNRRQRSLPDEIICIRASNLTSLTRSQWVLISLTSSRRLSSHSLSARAEDAVTRITAAVASHTARIMVEMWVRISRAALIDVNQMARFGVRP